MSSWYDAKKEHISLNDKKDEIDIYVFSDDFGAVWVSVKVEDIKEILKQTNVKKNKNKVSKVS
ncbi:MAG: hypothetical protein WC499_02620 [Patescibacteria group bacterium]